MFVQCPICQKSIPMDIINIHIDKQCQQPKKLPDFFKKALISKSIPSTTSETHPSTAAVVDREENCSVMAGQSADAFKSGKPATYTPLAELMRPRTLEDFTGQKIVSTLTPILQDDRIPSLIIYGPPGSGKTTLARIIGSRFSFFKEFSATVHNIQDIRKAEDLAQKQFKLTYKVNLNLNQRGVIFIDEIHRFTKAQQDVLLPAVEKGTYTLIGATTENPSFRLTNALLSRCKVLVFEKLEVDGIISILKRAVKSRSLSNTDNITEEMIQLIAYLADGDARIALNSLELVLRQDEITVDSIKGVFMKKSVSYDQMGEDHYNFISALHKSIRGSDENASLYWLERMLQGGEDPLYIARRLVRVASEDVGLANNEALSLAVSTFQACQLLGMPESDVILAHCVTFLARSPKSVEVYKAHLKAKEVVENEPCHPVPLHLRNATTKLNDEMGYGDGYLYNPDYFHKVKQEYLPKPLRVKQFFDFVPVKRQKEQ